MSRSVKTMAYMTPFPWLWSPAVRRPPRLRASSGRSTGVAEHRLRTVLTRVNAMGFIAAACALVIIAVPTTAGAQSAQDRAADTRREHHRSAERWFAAENQASAINALIARRTHDITDAEARVASLRHAAVARARLMYEGASVDYMTVIGDSAMESARRAQLIEKANARDNTTVADLTASLEDLRSQKAQLVKEQAREKDALDQLASERRALDIQLTALRAQGAGAEGAAAERNARARPRFVAVVQPSAGAPTAPPTAPPARSGGGAPSPAPPPTGGQVSPHHNDPFLVCTRARESSGDYS